MFGLKMLAGFVIGYGVGRMASQGAFSHYVGVPLTIGLTLAVCSLIDFVAAQ